MGRQGKIFRKMGSLNEKKAQNNAKVICMIKKKKRSNF